MSRPVADIRFFAAAELPWEAAGDGVRRKVLGYDGLLMMVQVEFEKGAIGAVHAHPHRQVTYIESGTFTVHVGDETRHLNRGDSFFVPPQTPHGVVALERGCLVDVFTPAREDFLQSHQ